MVSRTAALRQLLKFQELVPSYALQRNFDRSGHGDVSCLSKWIRYRVITEEESVASVLSHHSFNVAEKFVQELVWRTYWKGWLEQRPQVWASYANSVPALSEEFAANEGYRRAVEGRTGLSFFDDWTHELLSTGYLHNHTRMWFASVWIFTLALPWQLGADFMYRHLLDGDPASNTLSWRWVGGLQTPGKIYVARPDNIEKFSEGRWRPRASELNLNPRPLPMDTIGDMVPLEVVSTKAPQPDECVLVHDDDLSADLSAEFAGSTPHLLEWVEGKEFCSEVVRDHVVKLRRDTRERSNAVSVDTDQSVIQEMARRSSKVLHVMKPHCGELEGVIYKLTASLAKHGIKVMFHRRGWDESFFPCARNGFFPFWTAAKKRLERGR